MKFFEFIFLKRKLEHDKDNIINNLQTAKKRGRPMWLVLFPEGTGTPINKKYRCNYDTDYLLAVISDNTRQKSQEFAAKLHMVFTITQRNKRSW